MIVDDVVKAVNAGRMPIVLTERTEHAKLLTDAIEHRGIKTFLLIGKEAAKLKREKLAAIAAAGQTERFVIVAAGYAVFGDAHFVERKTHAVCGKVAPRLCRQKGSRYLRLCRSERFHAGKHVS